MTDEGQRHERSVDYEKILYGMANTMSVFVLLVLVRSR